MVDLEPGAINQVRSCPSMGMLFNPDNYVEA
jgi:tubulin beta